MIYSEDKVKMFKRSSAKNSHIELLCDSHEELRKERDELRVVAKACENTECIAKKDYNAEMARLTKENEDMRKHLDGLFEIAHPEDGDAMTDAPFTETHRKASMNAPWNPVVSPTVQRALTLTGCAGVAEMAAELIEARTQRDAALAEIDRLTKENKLLQEALKKEQDKWIGEEAQ